MHILIGLLLGVVLLYFWLIGQWFARVLVFLMLGALLGLFAVVLGGGIAPPLGVLGAIISGVTAWFVSGIPVYYWRHRMRVLLNEAHLAPPGCAYSVSPARKRELLSQTPKPPPPEPKQLTRPTPLSRPAPAEPTWTPPPLTPVTPPPTFFDKLVDPSSMWFMSLIIGVVLGGMAIIGYAMS